MRIHKALLLACAVGTLPAASLAQDAGAQETAARSAQEVVVPSAPPAEQVQGPPNEEAPPSQQQPRPAPAPAEADAEAGAAAPPPAEPETEAEAAAPPAPAPAQAAPARLSREETNALRRAVARGRLLFSLDRAGQISTRDMLSRISDPAAAGIAGWVAEQAGNAVSVTYYSMGENGPAAVYRAQILGGRVVSPEVFVAPANRPALTPLQARMAAARQAVEGLEGAACGAEDFNIFVVPPASPTGPVDVYKMSPQTERNRLPLGGHFAATVARDGSIASSRALGGSCEMLEVPDVPAGSRPGPLAVVHPTQALPSELHVFLALSTARPLLVTAGEPQRIWGVTGQGIARVRS